MKKVFRTILCGLFLCQAAGVWAAERIPVVASFSILGDLVAVVGGDRVSVTTLVGPDQDAHVFEPRPSDVKAVAQARVFVVNGLGFEGWLNRLQRSAGFKGTTIVAAEGVRARKMEDEDHPGRTVTDPHAWQDPSNVKIYVRNIARGLSELDPEHAAEYQSNGTAYAAQLDVLDAWAREQYQSIPTEKRRLITSHDAFGYHAAHYGVQFLAPQGVSTESEPSAKEVARLIKQIKRDKIKAVFMENMSNPKLLAQLARDAGVSPAGKLYADALSGKDGPAADYLTMMRYNVQQILAGLRAN